MRKITVFDNELLTCYLNTVSVNIIWDNFLILIGFTVSDFGELELLLTDTENHNYITRGTTVKNSLECGTVAHKVSQKIFHFFTSPFGWEKINFEIIHKKMLVSKARPFVGTS